jgi:mRNA-degrading endonuclease RelE of RelBE toxin-antitoxin system
MMEEYHVVIKKKVQKGFKKLPKNVLNKFFILAEQLKEQGPVTNNWRNFSKLGENEYHCHLTYHWVACWRCEEGTIIIEVYYVGSRENAPY